MICVDESLEKRNVDEAEVVFYVKHIGFAWNGHLQLELN